MHVVIRKFLERVTSNITPLIFLLNYSLEEIELLKNEGQQQQQEEVGLNEKLKIRIIDKKETKIRRSRLYISGGIYCVSNTILLLDMMENIVSPSIITGIVINHAEDIETILDKESWMSTILKISNKKSFILALTERAEMISMGGASQNIMKCLHLTNILLWPACRYEVQKELNSSEEQEGFQTEEYLMKMSKTQKRIQKILVKVIKIIVQEINDKFRNINNGDTIFFENEILNSHELYLKRKLARIKPLLEKIRMKRPIIRDLMNFRALLRDLVLSNAVEFHRRLIHCKKSAPFTSVWYECEKEVENLLGALISLSKTRIYKLSAIAPSPFTPVIPNIIQSQIKEISNNNEAQKNLSASFFYERVRSEKKEKQTSEKKRKYEKMKLEYDDNRDSDPENKEDEQFLKRKLLEEEELENFKKTTKLRETPPKFEKPSEKAVDPFILRLQKYRAPNTTNHIIDKKPNEDPRDLEPEIKKEPDDPLISFQTTGDGPQLKNERERNNIKKKEEIQMEGSLIT